MQISFVSSIAHIDPSAWQRCLQSDYPFLQYEFLKGLEDTGCTTTESGWAPHHCLALDEGRVVACVPLYAKTHSYGEYVFDWAFADAWRRSGLAYYPKLVSAAPFTPCTGARLLLDPSVKDSHLGGKVIQAIQQEVRDHFSSWHVLFHEEREAPTYASQGMHERQTCQFHWRNRNFDSFEDFLATFSSRKRKNLRKERARIAEQGLRLEVLEGEQINSEHCALFHRFYQVTYAKRSGHAGYLTRRFFTELLPTLQDSVMLVFAYEGSTAVAGALYFKDKSTLYGRYWGALRDYDGLHFEACYYQGIEYCIRNGLTLFNPGAQGEHKIQRGFEPTITQSHHFIADPRFDQAVKQFCKEECEHVQDYQAAARELLPFKVE